ncbi:unnamed protein product, partial [Prorocentrum cordatum]
CCSYRVSRFAERVPRAPMPASSCQSLGATLAASIKSSGNAKQWAAALDLFRSAPQSRVPVDDVLYNTAISACGKARQWERALMLLREMAGAKVVPDVILQCWSQRVREG